MALTSLVLLPIAAQRPDRRARSDGHLGLAYLMGAAGTLALGTRVVEELHDIDTILLGTAVAVLPEDFAMVAWTSVLLLVLHVWWWRGFAAISFDRNGALVRGLPVKVLEIALLLSLAAAISVSTRVIGALPTFGFSVLPAMAAIRVAPNVQLSLLGATLIGAGCGFLGYLAAYLWDFPVGAAQTLTGVALVAVAELVHQLLRRR